MKIKLFKITNLCFGFLFVSNMALGSAATIRSADSIATENKSIMDLDSEVHDAKLRASAGSQSRLSSSVNFYYSGGSAADPFGDERPTVGGSRLADPVSLSGNVGLRYRWDKNESLYFSTGYFQSRPFHSRSSEEEFEVNTPQLSYNNTFAFSDLEASSGLQLMVTTLEYMKEIGQLGSLGYSLVVLKSWEKSRVSGGVSLLGIYSAYDKDETQYLSTQNDYGFSLSPTVQYQMFNQVGLFSSLNVLSLMHYRSESAAFNMDNGRMTQTIGLGISATRDIFLAPDISFELEYFSFDKATLNLSATINM